MQQPEVGIPFEFDGKLYMRQEDNGNDCTDCDFPNDAEACISGDISCLAGYVLKLIDKPATGGSTPQQYGLPTDATELQDLIEYRNMNFAVGNIFKACYRLGIKGDDIYNLNKMIFFAEREIKRIKREAENG